MSEWELIGVVYVDSGSIFVGDPCYTIQEDGMHTMKSWDAWYEELQKQGYFETNGKRYAEPLGQGLGLEIATAYGDGSYPVLIKRNEGGRPAQVLIDFENSADYVSD